MPKNNSRKRSLSDDYYYVEKIDGFKFEDGVLKFFVHWKDYPSSMNTFEEYGNVRDCNAFQQYINNFRNHLQTYIDWNGQRMRSMLRDKIIATMTTKPKEEIVKDMIKLDEYGFDACEILYHVLPPSESFYKLFEELFELKFLQQLLEDQYAQFNALASVVNKHEQMSLQIENDIDFSVFQDFTYITENIWNKDLLLDLDDGIIKPAGINLYLVHQQPVTLFKTNNQGWGVRAQKKILAGTVIFECVGEVLSERAAKDLVDKKYLFPVAIRTHGQSFMVDATKYGNLSRFVNHSCLPNSRISSVSSNKVVLQNKLLISALSDIPWGREITIDYTQDSALMSQGIDCLCNNKKCVNQF